MLVTFCISLAALASFSAAADYCGNGKVMGNLNIAKLKGVWWEWEYSGMMDFLKARRCHALNFYPQADGKTIKTINNYAVFNLAERAEDEEEIVKHDLMHWTISKEGSANNGKLVLTVDPKKREKVPFSILDTDYNTYLLVLMCKKNLYRTPMTLTRKTDLTEEEKTEMDSKVKAALERSGLNKLDLRMYHTAFSTKDCKLPQFPETA